MNKRASKHGGSTSMDFRKKAGGSSFSGFRQTGRSGGELFPSNYKRIDPYDA
jgi:hypothetical protein